MSGLAGAPRTNDGSTVGVAYKANLYTYRATSDVIINASKEKKGVKNSLVDAANRSNVKVISMSIGDVFSSGTVGWRSLCLQPGQTDDGSRWHLLNVDQLGWCYFPCVHV
jgi:hypothetical protein